MSYAHKQLAPVSPMPRFELIRGNRDAQTPKAVVPQAPARFRGLHLVTSADSREKPSTFEQARRIVEQVEREIEQQAARARLANLRRFQPQSVPITPDRKESPAAIGSRLMRLLGF